MIVCSPIMVHTSMHLTRSNPTETTTHGLPPSSIIDLNLLSLLNYLPRLRGGRVRTGIGDMIGYADSVSYRSDGTRINDFFEGGNLGKVMEDDWR